MVSRGSRVSMGARALLVSTTPPGITSEYSAADGHDERDQATAPEVRARRGALPGRGAEALAPGPERLRQRVLHRGRAQHEPQLAQLPLRLVRPGRLHLGGQ